MRSGNLRVSANNESRAGQPGDKNETWRLPFQSQRRRVVAGWAPAAFPAVRAASAWPGHAVTFIVPFPPGGPVDTTARFATSRWAVSGPCLPWWTTNPALAASWARSSPRRRSPMATAFSSPPSTMRWCCPACVTTSATTSCVISSLGHGGGVPIVLVVNPSMPVNSVSELIAYASSARQAVVQLVGTGGGTHLAGELFNAMAGTRIQHVPYRARPPCRTWWADRCS